MGSVRTKNEEGGHHHPRVDEKALSSPLGNPFAENISRDADYAAGPTPLRFEVVGDRDSEETQARMESSMGVAEQARQRMESRLLAKEKEIGALENKVGRFTEHCQAAQGYLC